MAVAFCAAAVGVVVFKILCETVTENNNNTGSQRYKMTLKRKLKDRHGNEIEEEYTLEFASEAEMVRVAKECHAKTNAPIENRKYLAQ